MIDEINVITEILAFVTRYGGEYALTGAHIMGVTRHRLEVTFPYANWEHETYILEFLQKLLEKHGVKFLPMCNKTQEFYFLGETEVIVRF